MSFDRRRVSQPEVEPPSLAVAGRARGASYGDWLRGSRIDRKIAAAAQSAYRAAIRLIPGRLRRIYIPSAYSPIDRVAVIFFGLACGIFQAIGRFPRPFDAWNFWTADLAHLYTGQWATDQGYIYSPVLSQIVTILHPIGWQVFIVCWTTLLWGSLAYVLGRWAWLFVVMGIVSMLLPLPYEASAVLGYALNGNVQLIISAGLVLGLRGNALGWLPGLLTKAFSGLGLGWYLVRLEWRPLLTVLGVTAAIAAVSFVGAAGQWVDWIAFMFRNSAMNVPVQLEPVPFFIRLPMSLAVLVWGARTNRIWVVPIAVGWGSPILYAGTYPSMWIGAIPLFLEPRGFRR